MNYLRILLIMVVLFGCHAVDLTSTFAGGPKKVLIFPFTIHAEKDLTFLQKGITQMLAGRLAQAGKVIPLDFDQMRREKTDGPMNDATAVSMALQVHADYAILGSLTILGDNISTDARFLDTKTRKSIVTFSQFGKSQADVLLHINRFAGQVNQTVFGRKTAAYSAMAPEAAPLGPHPHKVLQGEQGIFLNPVHGSSYTKRPSFSLWKSRRFRTKINSMALGDVDGDGKVETVFVDNSTVHIYRYKSGNFIKLAEIKGKSYETYLGVDVADINGNGKAEIFVTNDAENNRLRSFVLEVSGTKFVKIADELGWYLRVLQVPGRPEGVLLGQKRRADLDFGDGVFELVWQNGQYEPGERQILPGNIKVYGFTYGDVINNGEEMVVAYTENEKLRLMDRSGRDEWTSAEPYGGGIISVEVPIGRLLSKLGSGFENEGDRYYLPQRIFITDLDKDGKKEVVVSKNHDSVGRLLKRYRAYESSHIECLAWDNVGLSPKWRTRKFTGQISDFAIGDMDNDGKQEVAFALVTNLGSALTGKPKSYIVLADIAPQKPPAEQAAN